MSITEERLNEIQGRLDAAMKDWSHQAPESAQVRSFFAHAPADLADLLAEVHRLRGKLADAWDEGCEAGVLHEDSIYWNAVGYSVTNPYLKEQS